jgi:hypothetical protein
MNVEAYFGGKSSMRYDNKRAKVTTYGRLNR